MKPFRRAVCRILLGIACVQILFYCFLYLLEKGPPQTWEDTGPFNCTSTEDNSTDLIFLCPQLSDRVTDPLLTLFTTVKDWEPRRMIHLNTFRNWNSLPGGVAAVLFLCNQDGEAYTIKLACGFGWDVVLLSDCNRNIPTLKAMMYHARNLYINSAFLGFANSDLLFDETLPATLEFLSEKISTNALFVGRRTNAVIESMRQIRNLKEVREIAYASSNLSYPHAVDYFISSNCGFPWHRLPNVVVGRRGYDNWLVYWAIKIQKVTVVDITETTLALHQNHTYMPEMTKRRARDTNMAVIPSSFKRKEYLQSLITCAPYKTMIFADKVLLVERVKKGLCGRIAGAGKMRSDKVKTLTYKKVNWTNLVLEKSKKLAVKKAKIGAVQFPTKR